MNETTDAYLACLVSELDFLRGNNKQLQARIAELETGFTIAMHDIDQDTPRFNALYAVLDGVVKSVDDYDAYLASQLKDGAKP